MSGEDEVVSVVVRVARALERSGVEYLLGGSIASSAYGEPRATRDIDIAVKLSAEQVPHLVSALGKDFAVSGRRDVARCDPGWP